MPTAARRHARDYQSRLRIRTRFAPLHRILPALRVTAAVVLATSLIIGGLRFLTLPGGVGALEFTPHTVVNSSSAIGILGTAIADMVNDGDNDIVTAGI